MSDLRIKMTCDGSRTTASVDELALKMRSQTRDAVRASLDVTAGFARAHASVNPKVVSGDLRSSIRATPVRGGGTSFSGSVGPHVVYGRIQELGGTVRAKRAPYLVFRGYDGRMHRKKSVVLPPRPYLVPGFDEAKAAIPMIFEMYLSRAAEE